MRFVACILLGLLLCPWTRAYDLITHPGSIYIVAWPSGPIPMQVKLGTSQTLSDGTNFDSSVQAAMQAWNAVIGTVQFAPQTSSPGAYSNGNEISEIVMDNTVDGTPFSNNALAVTISYSEGDTRVESDIVINNAYTWDSYRGSLQQNPVDIRRVAIHELGHVLGLGHPDQAGQSVTAIMNSTVSNVATMQSDDIAGARILYGAPGFVPANDLFANASIINSNNASSQLTGTNVGAGRESGEPAHAGESVGHSIWWKWTAPNSAETTITTFGSIFDTVLAVYTGSTVNNLTLVAENDDEEPPVTGVTNPARKRTSKVTFNAVGGTTYAIAVDGWDARSGPVTLNLAFSGSTVAAPSVQGHPSNQTVGAGQTAQFSVSVSGNPTPTYQWQRQAAGSDAWSDLGNGSGYSGVTTLTLSISTTLSMTGDQFRCVATNNLGSATSNSAQLTVNTVGPVIQSHPGNQTVTAGQLAQFIVFANGSPSPSYQWQRQAAGSGAWADLANGGGYSGATTTTLSVSTSLSMNGDQFRCIAINSAGSAMSNPASLTVNPAPLLPAITLQPVSQPLVLGGAATFAVSVTGTSPFYYQWRRNGANLSNDTRISGVTTNILTVTNVGMSDIGIYSVVVSNVAGSISSNGANLSLPGALAVGAGFQYGVVLRAGGKLWTGGRNYAGQLGDGTMIDRPYPVLAADEVVAADAGDNHALYIKSDGTLWGMGGNYAGQLGDGTKINQSIPRQIATDVVAASAGGASSAYLTKDGSLWVFGSNYGVAGDGSLIDRVTPYKLAAGVAAVSVASEHMLFIKSDRTLWAVGGNWYGQFGNGTSQNRYMVPQQIASDVVAASAGSGTTLFIKSDGSLWGAGFNGYGQLGDGTSTGRTSFGQIATNVVEVSAGSSGVLFIKSDNSLWIAHNELRGAGQTQPLPVQLTTNVVAVSAWGGFDFSYLYLKPDGSVVAGGDFNGVDMSSPPGDLVPPATPTGPAAAFDASANMVRLNWNLTLNATKYEVWRGTSNNPALATRIAGNVPVALHYDPTAVPGTTYFYWVKAVNPAGTSSFSVPAVLAAAPSITGQPATQTGGIGQNVTFAVVVVGAPTLSYQWRKDGLAIAGATHATLTLGSVHFGDAGSYDVVVTNSLGSATSNPATLAVRAVPADFSGDGTSDLVWTDRTSGDRYLQAMNGSGYLGARTPLTNLLVDWQAAGSGDFNGDGKSDILWQNAVTGACYVWFMDGTAYSGYAYVTTMALEWRLAGSGDFNGDGKADILWHNTATGACYVWLMDGVNYASNAYITTMATEWRPAGSGDFNGDAKADILWQNTRTGDCYAWFMDGTTYSSNSYLGMRSPAWRIVGTDDYNGDNQSDVAWSDSLTGERELWLMNGPSQSGTVSLGVTDRQWVLGWSQPPTAATHAPADFNADGKSDILWQNTQTGDCYVWFMNGTSYSGHAYLTTLPLEWRLAGTGDFNGDGKGDIFWQNTTTGDCYVWFMDGTSYMSYVYVTTMAADWRLAGTGDFNGDGHTDLVWRNSATGAYYVWLMDGAAYTAYSHLVTFGPEWRLANTGDFNNDGKADILWQNTATGACYAWYMDGLTYSSYAYVTTMSPEWRLAGSGDFNNDGKADVAWYNTAIGTYYIWLMNGTEYLSYGHLTTQAPEWRMAN